MYSAMVFIGTIPGPVVTANVGDTIEFTLMNEGEVIHRLDLYAGVDPSQVLSGNGAPGESKTWTLKANSARGFLHHCGADGLNGGWEHIANGMYGGIIVHPQRETEFKEFYMVFGEIYNDADKGLFAGSGNSPTALTSPNLLPTGPTLS